VENAVPIHVPNRSARTNLDLIVQRIYTHEKFSKNAKRLIIPIAGLLAR
jgi:hypothetical protein